MNWISYTKCSNEHRKKQLEALIDINCCGLKYILTDYIEESVAEVEKLLKEVKVCDKLTEEVFYTTKIEGANTTLVRTSEIHNGAPIDESNFSERVVLNCFQAVKMLNEIKFPFSAEQLIAVWRVLTHDCRENKEIDGDGYRIGQVAVGDYVPPHCDKVPPLMEDVMQFIVAEDAIHPIIKAILIHFAIEWVHPFCDGNGRVGHLLINHYLVYHGYVGARAISLSHGINNDIAGYYKAFSLAENVFNDCTPFIEYMLEVMLQTLWSVNDAKTFKDVLQLTDASVAKCESRDELLSLLAQVGIDYEWLQWVPDASLLNCETAKALQELLIRFKQSV